MSKYLPSGNEARLRKAMKIAILVWKRLSLLRMLNITGAIGSKEYTYTLRWPATNSDEVEPYDLRTDGELCSTICIANLLRKDRLKLLIVNIAPGIIR